MVPDDEPPTEDDSDGPPAEDTYDELAPEYDEITEKPIREHYEWPAISDLLPPLEGSRVLDAACGDGFYTQRFVEAGATAVGVDASEAMVERAQERFAGDDRVTVHRADLTAGLPVFDDDAFDLVVCQLALEHVEDWESVFAAFARVLEPGGRVVVSTSHPVRDYVEAAYPVRDHVLADEATYEAVERIDRDWGDEDDSFVVPFYRRPLSAVFGPATDAGLLVERVVDPEVTAAFAAAEPEYAAQFRGGPPNFVCLRFVNPVRVD